MTKKSLTRRDFLKLGSLAMTSLTFRRFFPPPPEEQVFEDFKLGRVTTQSINVLREPSFESETVDYRFRDEIIRIYAELTPPDGPAYNPHWYRIFGGYVHSAWVQMVEINHNQVIEQVPETGKLTEITVPFTQPYRFLSSGWEVVPDFYLYYQSAHWITDLVEGPDKQPWYQITSELGNDQYYAPATHLRPIPYEEIAPLSEDVPPEDKHIEVSLQWQTLTAYEGGQPVFQTSISSGIRSSSTTNGYPTMTPVGRHYVQVKMPSKHMGVSRLTDNSGDRALPGVPWTIFFAEGGYAIHGAYWHNNFGWRMSRGCVNSRYDMAKWLFRWTNPVVREGEWERRGLGTRIEVLE